MSTEALATCDRCGAMEGIPGLSPADPDKLPDDWCLVDTCAGVWDLCHSCGEAIEAWLRSAPSGQREQRHPHDGPPEPAKRLPPDYGEHDGD